MDTLLGLIFLAMWLTLIPPFQSVFLWGANRSRYLARAVWIWGWVLIFALNLLLYELTQVYLVILALPRPLPEVHGSAPREAVLTALTEFVHSGTITGNWDLYILLGRNWVSVLLKISLYWLIIVALADRLVREARKALERHAERHLRADWQAAQGALARRAQLAEQDHHGSHDHHEDHHHHPDQQDQLQQWGREWKPDWSQARSSRRECQAWQLVRSSSADRQARQTQQDWYLVRPRSRHRQAMQALQARQTLQD
ncbi:uncharacterized protein BP01DRAFT_366905 [Aspergillus saccharolyticus JOP 1030-1]|uniref:Uncharacterized protein n=1 Tax=Aspergillus saccharolyticus JOP 1030-1 TaxID=1450539 RepID=A0A318Z999_9EURO|nr:hypothetical protein BP01DRAFT_366905 [Aspergillus saccharolyticus JOP 1030-1]PYH43896.1 hypothetical protein BP01DRAFT_366905 [Aspergillus saccharolyticus JOP 1030-1]